MNTKPCLHCKAYFIPVRSDAKFCSHSCRQMAYVERSNSNDNIPVDQKTKVEINVNENGTNKYLTSKFDACDALQLSIGEKNNNETPSINRQENEKSVVKTAQKTGDKAAKKKFSKEKKTLRRQQYFSSINKQIDEVSKRIAVNNTNYKLKGWIEKLLEYETKSEIFRHEIQHLLESIIFFLSNERSNLPLTYLYSDFIENALTPKLERVIESFDLQKLLTFKLVIPQEFRKELTDILVKLTLK